MKRKSKINIHIIIISVFVIYIISANYIVNSFFPNDRALSFIKLNYTDSINNVEFNIETTKEQLFNDKKYVLIRGWAFIREDYSNADKIFLVLDSGIEKKAISVKTYFRADIQAYFKKVSPNSTRDNAFEISVPLDTIEDGRYKLGIFIEKKSNKHFSSSNTYITKYNNEFYPYYLSIGKDVKLPIERQELKFEIESANEEKLNNKEIIRISGWVFPKDISTDNILKYIILKNGHKEYIFDTHDIIRPDVTQSYANLELNLDNSGFEAVIPKNLIEDGEYKIGLYVDKGDRKYLVYSNKTYKK